MTDSELDTVLSLQLAVAWAGEAETSPPRMGWWRTSLCDEFGGEDLLRRLTPKTWEWGVLESCRAAAQRVDDRARAAADDPDRIVSLYRLGVHVDERLDDRLRELKAHGAPPRDTLPALGELLPDWTRERFEEWLAARGSSDFTTTATGRRLKGAPPSDPVEVATRLTAALAPCSEKYALPHYRLRS